ncbi:bifunctional arginine dihydrolase/ornithine cyclodeaminase [Leptothoe sp. PORK10 BA2]|uniref:bifunctional arginine dihydrolase/ornithine cyclodeaminase n=1 Tax=Leptothoe sp. PORK10 BA2 TaxID=3110254 RepID=UPI002B2209A1|nr:TIGR00300 family protein [Leptothoe sp. PORK10 BA2]MEA5463607.1 TIGR00300 family protein [Leptothoe sp. PORK10 BA2]
MTESVRILMCAPQHYDVDYVINPWMEGNVHRSSRDRAQEQWNGLHHILQDHATVDLVEPQLGWPDMVFTANAGLVLGNTAVLSRFFHPERQGEEPYFQKWFADHGYTVHTLPKSLPFEGAGDALLDRASGCLWAGYGFRSELDSHPYLAKWLEVEVLSLRLIDHRFYHLDTCFCPLANGDLLYYPPAFDTYSNHLIERRIPAEKRIAVNEVDAVHFACNAVNVGQTIVMNSASDGLQEALASRGFTVIETPLTEFLKAGGAAKCLTLRVTEARQASPQASSIQSRIVRLEGHLLDSGLVNRALDTIVSGGGSFQVLSFDLGEQRQDISKAEVKVSAPDLTVIEDILGQLVDLGAMITSDDTAAAHLEPVVQAGVAPDDFYVTAIYPTEVSVSGQWIKVQGQRMDGAIAITHTPDGPVAHCKLLRELQVGESVVVGSAGIRTKRTASTLQKKSTEEFSFMGAGVSSERRVELVVEQIAWDLRRIRDQGGKAVVTAGPVVIHTGGSEHLQHLIREGYVHGLLGGNAIAVHDIEQSMMGTSLGMDMKRGVSVHGGHRHHLKAINAIRRCGSIANAVDQGILQSGVMYECVKNNVPFSLAGSIRDDGPLPDTQMDLIQAQEDYAQLIAGADLILMLSTMLHSIGVGNMTPAGVKMVCVDINPAVVTKLSDRGSLESIGVVTDVGLFLSLLVTQLNKLTGEYARV